MMAVLHAAAIAVAITAAVFAFLVELDMLIDAIQCGGGCW